jgi:cysteinyl-tRNA synthetase
MLQLQNTFTQTKEKFKPIHQELVKVYSCGPTPYNFVHIGNLRAYLFEDAVIRTLRYLGYKVQTAMNVTDIDDKTIRRSIAENVSLQELTEKYTALFLEDIKNL